MDDRHPTHARTATRGVTVVEFAGLPGSGKTTSIPTLEHALGSRGVEALTRIRVRTPPRALDRDGVLASALRLPWFTWHRVRSVMRYRAAAVTAIRALARSSRTTKHKEAAFRRFAITLDNYESSRSRRSSGSHGVVILSEGIAQSAWALFVNPPRDAPARGREIAGFVEQVPVPDAVVYLRVPPEICLERLGARRPFGIHERFEGLEPRTLERVLSTGTAVLDQVVAGLAARGSVVVEVPGDAPRDHAPRIWQEAAERIVHSAEHGGSR